MSKPDSKGGGSFSTGSGGGSPPAKPVAVNPKLLNPAPPGGWEPPSWAPFARAAPAACEDLMARLIAIVSAHHKESDENMLTKDEINSIRASKEYTQWTADTAELTTVDFLHVSHNERVASYLNVYNMLVIHSVLAAGWPPPSGTIGRIGFYSDWFYQLKGIGLVSSAVIEHALLRASLSRPDAFGSSFLKKFTPKDAQYNYIVVTREPLLTFALCSGAGSSPHLKVYKASTLASQLQDCAREYIRAHTHLHVKPPKHASSAAKEAGSGRESNTDGYSSATESTGGSGNTTTITSAHRINVWCSKLIEWFRFDFAAEPNTKTITAAMLLNRLLIPNMHPHDAQLINQVRSANIKLKYSDWDWTLFHYRTKPPVPHHLLHAKGDTAASAHHHGGGHHHHTLSLDGTTTVAGVAAAAAASLNSGGLAVPSNSLFDRRPSMLQRTVSIPSTSGGFGSLGSHSASARGPVHSSSGTASGGGKSRILNRGGLWIAAGGFGVAPSAPGAIQTTPAPAASSDAAAAATTPSAASTTDNKDAKTVDAAASPATGSPALPSSPPARAPSAPRSAPVVTAELLTRLIKLVDVQHHQYLKTNHSTSASSGGATSHDPHVDTSLLSKEELSLIEHSPEFQEWVADTGELRVIEFEALTHTQKVASFLNLYSMLCLHSAIILGPPSGALARLSFYTELMYELNHIGAVNCALLEHALLRAPMSKPDTFGSSLLVTKFASSDPRRRFAVPAKEPLISFALASGTGSGAHLQVYNPDTLSQQLQWATCTYLHNHVYLQTKTRNRYRVWLPKLVEYYKADLLGESSAGASSGGSTASKDAKPLLDWLARYLPPSDALQLTRMRSSCVSAGHPGDEPKIRFFEYEWSMFHFHSKPPPLRAAQVLALRHEDEKSGALPADGAAAADAPTSASGDSNPSSPVTQAASAPPGAEADSLSPLEPAAVDPTAAPVDPAVAAAAAAAAAATVEPSVSDIERLLETEAIDASAMKIMAILFLVFFLGKIGGSFLFVLVIGGIWLYARYQSRQWVARGARALVTRELLVAADSNLLRKVLGATHLPSWVILPDVERVEWLNRVVSGMWKELNVATEAVLKLSMNPLMLYYKPSWLAFLSFSKMDLGADTPPLIKGIKIIDTGASSGHGGHSGSHGGGGGSGGGIGGNGYKEVVLDIDLVWHSRPSIVLDCGLKGGAVVHARVDNLSFDATLRVVLTPLVPVYPCFGALCFSFTRKPNIHFTLSAANLNLTNIPGLSSFLDNLLKNVLVDLMVWPRRYVWPVLKLKKTVLDAMTSRATKDFSGLLHVRVVEAKSLSRSAFGGRPDPYVVVQLDDDISSKHVTKVKKSTSDPAWAHEEWDLFVVDETTQSLVVRVEDKALIGRDTTLGDCVIPLASLLRTHHHTHNLKAGPAVGATNEKKQHHARHRAGAGGHHRRKPSLRGDMKDGDDALTHDPNHEHEFDSDNDADDTAAAAAEDEEHKQLAAAGGGVHDVWLPLSHARRGTGSIHLILEFKPFVKDNTHAGGAGGRQHHSHHHSGASANSTASAMASTGNDEIDAILDRSDSTPAAAATLAINQPQPNRLSPALGSAPNTPSAAASTPSSLLPPLTSATATTPTSGSAAPPPSPAVVPLSSSPAPLLGLHRRERSLTAAAAPPNLPTHHERHDTHASSSHAVVTYGPGFGRTPSSAGSNSGATTPNTPLVEAPKSNPGHKRERSFSSILSTFTGAALSNLPTVNTTPTTPTPVAIPTPAPALTVASGNSGGHSPIPDGLPALPPLPPPPQSPNMPSLLLAVPPSPTPPSVITTAGGTQVGWSSAEPYSSAFVQAPTSNGRGGAKPISTGSSTPKEGAVLTPSSKQAAATAAAASQAPAITRAPSRSASIVVTPGFDAKHVAMHHPPPLTHSRSNSMSGSVSGIESGVAPAAPHLPTHSASLHSLGATSSVASGALTPKSSPNAGALIVRVHRGENLISCDSNGKSDPYVVLSLGNKSVKTKIIKKTLSPVWDEQFEFEVSDVTKQILSLKCWDWDFGTADDPMGDLDIVLMDIVRSGSRVLEHGYLLKNAAHGSIVMTIIFKALAH